MLDAILSTQEVSALLNVTETTVKRWADEGKIPCSKTLGGHRKFSIRDIVQFAEKHSYTISGTLAPPLRAKQMEQLEFSVQTRNYRRISAILLEELLEVDREGLSALLLYLAKHHIPLPAMIDEVVRPALVEIGERWSRGELSVEQEHRSTQAFLEAFVRVAPELHRKPSNGLDVVLACPEGELHEVGLRSLSYAFEAEGWTTHYVGANTPVDSIIDAIRSNEADLVCLSFTIPPDDRSFIDAIRRVATGAHSAKAKLLVGGFYVGSYVEQDLDCDHIALSVTDAVQYARDAFALRPGPKRK
jgi:excisionase family DNA binding protein